jgi:hypothetical protein
MEAQSPQTYALHFPDGLSRVSDVVPSDEFVICVNGEESTLSLVEAVFLSPRVFSALKSDPTIRFLEITDDEIEGKHVVDLLNFVRGGVLKLTKSSRLSLVRLSRELRNRDLTQLFLGVRDDETINERVGDLRIGFDLTVHSRDDLFVVDVDTLEDVFRSDRLRIESEDWLLYLILDLGCEYRGLLDVVKYEFLSPEGLSKFVDHFSYCEMTDDIWTSLVRRLRDEKPAEIPGRHVGPQFPSSIVSEFPSVLSVIEEKNVRLLYRGTRDGFTVANCHPLVTGHSNLVVLVESTGGWIFGGYAHCKWPESHHGWSGDPSQKSFLFTLKNPHNIPPRRFAVESTRKENVLFFYNKYLVWMGLDGAIALMLNCNANSTSNNRGFQPGGTFVNDSGHEAKTLFTGSETYTVKEVEIFEFFE